MEKAAVYRDRTAMRAKHKGIWQEGMPSVYDVALYNATVNKVYDEEIIDRYSDEEWVKINSWIDHDREIGRAHV